MRRFVILSCLYFAQGLPFGFFSHAVPVLLNRTHPPEIAGLSSLLAIPWAFKFLLGPLVDKLGPGRRKLAIVPMQLLTLSTLVVVGLLDISEARLTPMLVGFFLVSVFSAVQDVATDALSIDVLSPREYGQGAGIQYGAYRAGMIIGGGGVLAMVDHVGYREGFLLMASSIALASIPVLPFREQRVGLTTKSNAERGPGFLARFRKFIVRSESRRLLLFLGCYKFGDALAAGMVTRWFVKQGLTTSEIALSRGFTGGVAAIIGGGFGGLLVRRLATRSALRWLGGMQGAAILVYLVLALLHPVQIGMVPMDLRVYYAASAFEHFFGGAATVGLFAQMMEASDADARATDFSVQACLLALVTGVGLLLSGFITKWSGLLGLFIVASLFGLLSPLAVTFLPRRAPAP